MTKDLIPADNGCDDVDALLRVIDGLLEILWQLKSPGALSRYEVAIISGGEAIADCIRRRHVGS
jgi:hypothetical protein